ncbi:hypothetical protein ACHAXR_000114, partial [Thalassiosira sp. AJA248-18]
GEYGPFRLYHVKFDDGDQLDALDDYWVFPKNDYLLTMHYDEMGLEPIGVKKVFDKKSCDRWAKLVGWYSVIIHGHEQQFSLLSDAMKAHDAHVVNVNGGQTKKSDLNMPNDYAWLFDRKETKHELKEETDDDSRFSEAEDESVESHENKRR